jgi:hypothetical protein
MTAFQSARDAKEFLIGRIVEEATCENIRFQKSNGRCFTSRKRIGPSQTGHWFLKNSTANIAKTNTKRKSHAWLKERQFVIANNLRSNMTCGGTRYGF